MGLDFGSLLGGFAKQATKTITDREDAERDFDMRKRIAEFNAKQQERMEIASEQRKLKAEVAKYKQYYLNNGFEEPYADKAAKAGELLYNQIQDNAAEAAKQGKSIRDMFVFSDATGQSIADEVGGFKFIPPTPDPYEDKDVSEISDILIANDYKIREAIASEKNPTKKAELEKQLASNQIKIDTMNESLPEANLDFTASEAMSYFKFARQQAGLNTTDFGDIDNQGNFSPNTNLYSSNIFDYLERVKVWKTNFGNKIGDRNQTNVSFASNLYNGMDSLQPDAIKTAVYNAISASTPTSPKVFNISMSIKQSPNEQFFKASAPVNRPDGFKKNDIIKLNYGKNKDGKEQFEYIIWGGSFANSVAGDEFKYTFNPNELQNY